MHGLSATSFLLDIKSNDKSIGHATGFLYRKNDNVYLITNWHVITGRNLFNKSTHPHNPPTQVVFQPVVKTPDGKYGIFNKSTYPFICNLYDANNKPVWLEHPSLDVDIVAIQLDNDIVKEYCTNGKTKEICSISCINDYEFINFIINIADDCFVLGYPFGKPSNVDMDLPVWKRATIASEPEHSYFKNIPSMLIDTTTRTGMSGSPVVIGKDAYITMLRGNPLIKQANDVKSYKFIGVYSGRVDEYNMGTEDSYLGLVWKKELIDEIIDNGKIASI